MPDTDTEIPRPEGWTDAAYEQLVELITLARAIEELGGSEGVLALIQAEPAHAPTTGRALSWAKGVPFTATVKAKGWSTVNVEVRTQDGYTARTSFSTFSASLLWGTHTISGELGFTSWNALKAGTNYITVNTSNGIASLVVNGNTQGEFSVSVPRGVPSLNLKSSFNWD